MSADIIVIGAGLNGLVAGAYLARHRKKVLILDQAGAPGGAAITTEFAPGFRVPTFSHALGPIHRDVSRAIGLHQAKVDFLSPNCALTVLGAGEKTLTFHRDPVLTAASINSVSAADAGRWREFLQVSQRIAGVIGALQRRAPPAIDGRVAREWWPMVAAGRRARSLGRRDLARLVRWMPMAVADLVGEWFESDLVQAAIAARAIAGNFAGPWSAGTGAMLLQRLAEDPMPVGGGVSVKGGPGALADAIASIARTAGAEIKLDARVRRVTVTHGRATGVVLDDGREIPAGTVIAAIDPKRTMLELVDPTCLPPTIRQRALNIRARGVTAKINLALAGAPAFAALGGDAVPLGGRLLMADSVEYLERAFDAAKYGEISGAPWLEASVPSVADPLLAPSGQHVMSIYVHFAPRHLRAGAWADHGDRLYRAAMDVVSRHAPSLESQILAREILTPEDLERRLGAWDGHIFHGEPTLDQTWMARPLLGWSQYRSPVDGLFFASAGAHPGGGLTGMSGLLAARAVVKSM